MNPRSVPKVLLPLLLALTCGACAKTEKKEPTEEKAEQTVKEEPKAEPKQKERPKRQGLAWDNPTTRLGEIPTYVDLEVEASRRILPQNLEAELDRLEAELAGLAN